MAGKRGEAKDARPAAAPTPYVVFARRFRPQSFADVVGQETVTAALRQALKTGRLAQAYLLGGPRGVGKTSLARIFAKAVNCERGKGPGGAAEEPCNACDACQAIQAGRSLDVIEMDAATHRGIQEIRELRENVGLSPAHLRAKVYIVDEVHMLTQEAWNAFLKTLEEPPAHVKFIFATTDPDRVPETILSRCQRYDLRRIGLADIVKRLKKICAEEKIEASVASLERIAALAKGGLRDAEGLLDQAVNLGAGAVDDEVVRRISGAAPDELIFALLDACARGEVAAALTQAGAALDAGADPEDLLSALGEALRGTLIAKTCGQDSALLEGQSHLRASYAQLGSQLSEDQVLLLLQLFSAARRQVKEASQARLPLEMALVRASRAKDLVDLGTLVSALQAGAAGAPAAARNPGAVTEGRAGYGAKESPRPNSAGRWAGAAEARPAAPAPHASAPAPDTVRTTPSDSSPVLRPHPAPAHAAPAAEPAGTVRQEAAAPERWEEVLSAVRPLPGGAFTATALTHARGVKLDLAAGKLELAFSPAQGFYREALERPERLAPLRETLEKIYGRGCEVYFVRAAAQAQAPSLARAGLPPNRSGGPERNLPPAERLGGSRTLPAAGSGQTISEAERSRPAAADERGSMETEVEFDDEGALPLSAHGAAAGSGEAEEALADPTGGLPEDAELGPARAQGALPVEMEAALSGAAAGSTGGAATNAAEHPWVKVLVERIGGEVVRVERRPRKAQA